MIELTRYQYGLHAGTYKVPGGKTVFAVTDDFGNLIIVDVEQLNYSLH